ncbi:MAG: CPBP family intramembrane metalloprotease, partial [Candidatus Bathyarchaeota archaeon]
MSEANTRDPKGSAGILKRLLHMVLLISVLALLALYAFSIPLGLELFLFGNLSDTYPPSYPLVVQFFDVRIEAALGFAFMFLITLYALCFVLAWKQGNGFHDVVRSLFSKPVGFYMKNSLFALPVLSSLTYIAVDTIHSFQESQGIPIGKPPLPKDPLLAFFELGLSPLAEEITYRIVPLGVFLAVRLLTLAKDQESLMSWKNRLKVCLAAFASPEDAKRELGLRTMEESGFWRGISRDEWVMILFTTVFFALSHYFFTSTWDVGKIASTFVQGLIWGLAYLTYGIQAPILLHWFFNLYLYTYALTAIVHPNLSFLSFLSGKLTLGLGVLGFLTFAYWCARELAGTWRLSLKTVLFSAGKVKEKLAVSGDQLLSNLRRMDLFDIATVILALAVFSMRLAIVNFPSPQIGEKYYETGFVFDESYYVKAARKMLTGEASNNEHPPLLKALIMLGIALLGDNPLGWRIFPIIMSSISVALVYRTAVLVSGKKIASFSASLLFATDVTAFNIGQIGMLDAPSMMFVL